MTRIFSHILLFTFGVSLSLYPLMEGGHELLHQFKNTIHDHEITAHDHHHTIADHHVGESHNHDDVNEESEGCNFISLLFGLSKPMEKMRVRPIAALQSHSTMFVFVYIPIHLCPPSPPPLG